MVTGIAPRPGSDQGLKPYRMSVKQFESLIEAGAFPDQVRVELLGGVLFRKMTKNDPHDFAVGLLGAILNRRLEPAWFAREEKSVVLGKFWRPEPDVAVVRGPRQRYRDCAPRADDLGLLIEVSDATYIRDRGVKWRRYAAVGIGTYWIVNLAQKRIEVSSRLSGQGRAAAFQDAKFHGTDAEVPLIFDGREQSRVSVKDVVGSDRSHHLAISRDQETKE